MESVQELDEYETYENEDLSVISPTLITTPGESEEFLVPKSSPLKSNSMATSYKNKKSSSEEQSRQTRKVLSQSREKKFDSKLPRARCSNLSKYKICKASKLSKTDDSVHSETRISTGETSRTSSTFECGSIPQPFTKISSSSPDQLLLTEKINRLPKVEMLSPVSDKLPFNHGFYKLVNVSSRTEDCNTSLDKAAGDIPNEDIHKLVLQETSNRVPNSKIRASSNSNKVKGNHRSSKANKDDDDNPHEHIHQLPLPERSNRLSKNKITASSSANKVKGSHKSTKANTVADNNPHQGINKLILQERSYSLNKTKIFASSYPNKIKGDHQSSKANNDGDEDIDEELDFYDCDKSTVESDAYNEKGYSSDIEGVKDDGLIGSPERSVVPEDKNSSINKVNKLFFVYTKQDLSPI